MRLDLFLKWSRVILRRTVAKETCDAGRVHVNEVQARAGSDVRVGDSVTIDLPRRRVRFKIRTIPAHAPDKAAARDMVELLEDLRKE
jgi:ribosomal 50S subunit-recycling heat shock protein